MAFKVFEDSIRARKRYLYVTINADRPRLGIPYPAYRLLEKNCGSEVTHVQFLVDEDDKSRIMMRPCKPEEPESKKLVEGNKSFAISATSLLRWLAWDRPGTTRVRIEWNAEHGAAQINLDKIID